MTALVGPSGEGKTTCVSLLERLYEPQEGEILLDNEPLKSYDHRFLHQKVCSCSILLIMQNCMFHCVCCLQKYSMFFINSA